MIEVRKQVPGVYYNESRDFQLIGRIFETILNYVKTNADCIENAMDTNLVDDKLVDLLSKTVGFESRHEYNVKDLKTICGCFSTILKYKGTKVGIDMAVSALLNAQGILDSFNSEIDRDTRNINVYIPNNTNDVILLEDLFEYIMPVGWSYTIISAVAGDKTSYSTAIITSILHTVIEKDTDELDIIAKLPNDVETTSTRIIQKTPEEPGPTPVITDLTGTKWVLNSIPSTTSNATYSINFNSNSLAYSSFIISTGHGGNIRYNGTHIYDAQPPVWVAQAYRTIEIISGADVTNTDFIEWLLANATQVSVTNLTNTTWTINNSLFNMDSYQLTVNFVSNNTNYSSLRINDIGIDNRVYYGNTKVYDGQTGWINQNYRTVNITSGTDIANPDFIVWLQANATLQQ